MARQNFIVSEENDHWLRQQVTSKEYSNKSELVNDLIRQPRNQQKQIDWIRAKLDRVEQRGFSDRTPQEIVSKVKNG